MPPAHFGHEGAQTRFYYPDTSVVCETNPDDGSFLARPVVIFEVLSKKTQRIDEGEKKDAYLAIPSLVIYALVEQKLSRIVIYRRTAGGFIPEVYTGHEAIIPLPEIGIELSLAEIYAGVDFGLETDPDED